jgi:hypothetical protein
MPAMTTCRNTFKCPRRPLHHRRRLRKPVTTNLSSLAPPSAAFTVKMQRGYGCALHKVVQRKLTQPRLPRVENKVRGQQRKHTLGTTFVYFVKIHLRYCYSLCQKARILSFMENRRPRQDTLLIHGTADRRFAAAASGDLEPREKVQRHTLGLARPSQAGNDYGGISTSVWSSFSSAHAIRSSSGTQIPVRNS